MTNELSKKELNQLIALAKRVLWSSPDTRKIIQENGINITPANFYSDIPLIKDIDNSFEYRNTREVFNSNIFKINSIKSFIKKISVYSNEFNVPIDGNKEDPDGFFWKNPYFSFSDAMSYYCVIRHFKPKKIVEIGSGFSTLVADKAVKKNNHGEIVIIEPYPMKILSKLETVTKIENKFVQDIKISKLINLIESANIWFIDSTHTVKNGSDCLYIYLKAMPEIKTNLIVHSHDVFLPYSLPKEWGTKLHIYWTEQYLLYSYLLKNQDANVLYGSNYASKKLKKTNDLLMNKKYAGGGGSLWYELNPK